MTADKQIYENYVQWMTNAAFAPTVQHKRLTTSVPLDLFLRCQPEARDDPPTNDVLLCLLKNGTLHNTCLDFGAGRIKGEFRPGSLFLAMHNHAHVCQAQGPFELLTAAFPFSALKERLDVVCPSFSDFGALHACAFADPEAERLLRALWRSADNDAPSTLLRIEGSLNMLLARLLELTGKATYTFNREAALSTQMVEQVREYIHAHLMETIRLDELAAIADCSVFQISRRFKQSLGCSPHTYLTRIRIEQVKRMLASPRPITLTDIAASCGFSDQAHMTRVFKKQVGLTPGDYRCEFLK